MIQLFSFKFPQSTPFFAAQRKYSPSSYTHPAVVLMFPHQVPILQHQLLKPQQVNIPTIQIKENHTWFIFQRLITAFGII
jgi:hypothetical protein